jgi:hypothetical protein
VAGNGKIIAGLGVALGLGWLLFRRPQFDGEPPPTPPPPPPPTPPTPPPTPPPPPSNDVRFELVNTGGAPRWGINAGYYVGNTGTYYGTPVKAAIGEPIILPWADIMGWAGSNFLIIDVSLRDAFDRFYAPGSFFRLDASAVVTGQTYTIDCSTRRIVGVPPAAIHYDVGLELR